MLKKKCKKEIKQVSFHSAFLKNRKGIATEYLPWILISLAVLAIVIISIVMLKDKGISLIDKIKDLFKFR